MFYKVCIIFCFYQVYFKGSGCPSALQHSTTPWPTMRTLSLGFAINVGDTTKKCKNKSNPNIYLAVGLSLFRVINRSYFWKVLCITIHPRILFFGGGGLVGGRGVFAIKFYVNLINFNFQERSGAPLILDAHMLYF